MNNPPPNPQSVTPAWLTAVLRQEKRLHHAKITSLSMETIGGEEGFSGNMARYKLLYDRPEASAPQTLIGKFSLEESSLRQFLYAEYQNEALFYAQLAELIKIKTPTCFYHYFDPQTGALLLLLEDLTHWQLPNLIASVSANEAYSVIQTVAQGHASTWNHPALAQMEWLPTLLDFTTQPYTQWWQSYPAKVAQILPDFVLPASFLQAGDQFFARMGPILAQLSEPPFCCLHRDVHADNLLFVDGEGIRPLTLLDWSMVAKGRGVYDVTYFMISSLTPTLRRTLETELLHLYHQTLCQNGVINYSFAQCWHDYKLSFVGKLLVTILATVLFNNSSTQRRAWRQVDLQRSITFINDHQLLKLL